MSTFVPPPQSDIFGLRGLNSLFGDQAVAQRNSYSTAIFTNGLPSDMVKLTQRWDLSAVVGVFTVNEPVLGTPSGAYGIIEVTASPALIYTLDGAFASGDTITGLSSGATATIATGLNARPSTSNSRLVVGSGTTAPTNMALSGARLVPYTAGYELGALFTGVWPDGGAANITQYLGLATNTDGFLIGYNGTSFGVVRRNNSVNTFTAQAAFTIDPLDGSGPSGIAIDTTAGNIFRISFGYLGYAGVIWWILKDDLLWYPFHMDTAINASAELVVRDPRLSTRIEIDRAVGAVGIERRIFAGSLSGYTLGPTDVSGRVNSTDRTAAITTGAERYLYTVRNNLTFNSTTNRDAVRLQAFSVIGDGTRETVLRIRRNSRLTTPTFVAVDSLNSCCSVDTTAAAFTASKVEYLVGVGSRVGADVYLAAYDIYLLPGESVTVTAVTGANQSITSLLRWSEGA